MSTEQTPAFLVAGRPVHGDLVLAPLAGYSDLPYRLVCRAMGSAMSYTECIAADGLVHNHSHTWELARFDIRERPVVLQVIGGDPDRVVEACQQLEQLGPDFIDINMGCPVPHTTLRGGGAGLLRDPDRITRIFSTLTRQLGVPVTAKIRLGWDDQSRNYLDIARILEDHGAALIAVHGRTRVDRYDVPADWDAIAEVKRAVHIPVLANGDVRCVADIERIKRHTGCDGVMIGRGAIGNPWIFRRRDLGSVPAGERMITVRHHLEQMVAFYGERKGVLLFRKHLVRYLNGLAGASRARGELMTCTTQSEVVGLLGTAIGAHPVAHSLQNVL